MGIEKIWVRREAREHAEVGKKIDKVEMDANVNMNMKKVVEAEDEE